MSNDLTTQNKSTSLAATNLAALKAYTESNKVSTFRFMKWDGQRGAYLTKDEDRNEVNIKFGTKFVLNVPEMYHGFICWVNNEVKKREFFRMMDHPVLPDQATLPDYGPYEGDRDGWQEQISLPMVCLDDKLAYVWTQSGTGALNAIKRALQAIISSAMRDGHDLETEVPVLALDKGKYFNKKLKKDSPIPKITVVEWMKRENLDLTISAKPYDLEDEEKGDESAAGGSTTNTDV